MTTTPESIEPEDLNAWAIRHHDQADENTEERVERRGLCGPCGIEFEATLPPAPDRPHLPEVRQHWEDADEYKQTWQHPEKRLEAYHRRVVHRDQQEYIAEHAARLKSWPRCENCPIWDGEREFTPVAPTDEAPSQPRCKDCTERAKLITGVQFPQFPYLRSLGIHDPQDVFDASWITMDSHKRSHAAWKAAWRSQPRCPKCPDAPVATSRKGGSLAKDILLVLAGNGAAMNVNDILAAGIKGLTKNNVPREMKALADSGQVKSSNRGPSKYFELP